MANLSKGLRRFGVKDALAISAQEQLPMASKAYWVKHLNEELNTSEGRGKVARGAAAAGLGTNALVQEAGGWRSLIKHTPPKINVPEIGSKLMNPTMAEVNQMARDAASAAKGGAPPGQSFMGRAQKWGTGVRAALPIHLAATGAGTAVQGLSTPTEDYEGRTGLRGLPARAAGVMQDFGNNLTFGAAGDAGEGIAGMIDAYRGKESGMADLSKGLGRMGLGAEIPGRPEGHTPYNPLTFKYRDTGTPNAQFTTMPDGKTPYDVSTFKFKDAGAMADKAPNPITDLAESVAPTLTPDQYLRGAPVQPGDPDRLAKSEQVAGFIRGMPERRLSAESLAADNSQTLSNDLLKSLGFSSSPFDARRFENQQLTDFTDKVGLQNEIIEPKAPPTFLRSAPVSNPVPQAGSGLKTGRDLIDGSMPTPSPSGEEEKKRTKNPVTVRG